MRYTHEKAGAGWRGPRREGGPGPGGASQDHGLGDPVDPGTGASVGFWVAFSPLPPSLEVDLSEDAPRPGPAFWKLPQAPLGASEPLWLLLNPSPLVGSPPFLPQPGIVTQID